MLGSSCRVNVKRHWFYIRLFMDPSTIFSSSCMLTLQSMSYVVTMNVKPGAVVISPL